MNRVTFLKIKKEACFLNQQIFLNEKRIFNMYHKEKCIVKCIAKNLKFGSVQWSADNKHV